MDLRDSLDRLMASDRLFGESFYERFFAKAPEAKKYFEGVDWRRQHLVLTLALGLLQQHHDRGYPVSRQYLEFLGSKHHDRGVPLWLYTTWRDALLETLADFEGPYWTSGLEASWRAAFQDAYDAMTRGYAERVTI